jgi:hypothetical protein
MTGVNETGPSKPDGSGFQSDASNKPFFTFSRLRAGMLVL